MSKYIPTAIKATVMLIGVSVTSYFLVNVAFPEHPFTLVMMWVTLMLIEAAGYAFMSGCLLAKRALRKDEGED